MKAFVVEHLGEKGSLKDLPVPQPGPHEILVRVIAAGVNPIDWKRRERAESRFPFVLGQDFAGVVSATGNRVSKYREGERIFGTTRIHGTYAEYTVAPEDEPGQPVAKIPDDVGDADAAALPTAGLTALAALEWLAVTKGTTLLVLGASGGIGVFAVQVARDRGARVIGTARSTNAAFARSLGVEEFVAYDTENVTEAVKKAHPDGIDAVMDLVDDGDAIKTMADLLHHDGRILSTINAADVDWFAQRQIAAENLYLGDAPQATHAGLRTLLELVEQQRMRVSIANEYPLPDAIEALAAIQRGGVLGKIVITIG